MNRSTYEARAADEHRDHPLLALFLIVLLVAVMVFV